MNVKNSTRIETRLPDDTCRASIYLTITNSRTDSQKFQIISLVFHLIFPHFHLLRKFRKCYCNKFKFIISFTCFHLPDNVHIFFSFSICFYLNICFIYFLQCFWIIIFGILDWIV